MYRAAIGFFISDYILVIRSHISVLFAFVINKLVPLFVVLTFIVRRYSLES